jgi:hypothetical protein
VPVQPSGFDVLFGQAETLLFKELLYDRSCNYLVRQKLEWLRRKGLA